MHPTNKVEVIRLLVSSYFDIVRSNLADLVPKTLMRHLVRHSQRGMQQHLIATLYRWGACVQGYGGIGCECHSALHVCVGLRTAANANQP